MLSDTPVNLLTVLFVRPSTFQKEDKFYLQVLTKRLVEKHVAPCNNDEEMRHTRKIGKPHGLPIRIVNFNIKCRVYLHSMPLYLGRGLMPQP